MLLTYDRPVPAHWRAQLAAITPPNACVSWLELLWESGSPERPIHRWALYEAIPAHAVTWWQQEMLLEEPVESAGHRKILDYYLSSGGVLLQPFWVIQGTNGGHKVEFSDSEKKLLYLEGLPVEPPDAGELAYADFDQRTIRQVMKWDRLRQGYASVQEAKRRGDDAAERQFREELVGWLSPQIAGAVDDVAGGVEWSSALREVEREPDFEDALGRYVESGAITV